jgi:hypothetical protein
MVHRNVQDIVGGGLAIAVGLAFFVMSFDYGIGNARVMEGGFFPLMISLLVIAIGAVVAIKGFWTEGAPEAVLWRPFVTISAAVVVFALTVQLLGLLPAVALTVAMSALGDPEIAPPHYGCCRPRHLRRRLADLLGRARPADHARARALLMSFITVGLPAALAFDNLLYCFVGVFLGTLIGVLPGVGPLATISLLLPISMYLSPTGALVMLAGVYYGASYGGSITAILLNLPGETSSAITALDGYQMRNKGRAGVAIFVTTAASFIGGAIGIVLLMSSAPYIVQMSRMFGAAEYFAAMLFALVVAPSITQGSMIKGYLMVAMGLLLGCVGLDVNSGAPRFSFGAYQLYEGINIAIIAMGLFGIAEIVESVHSQKAGGPTQRIGLWSMVPTRRDMRDMLPATLRGSAVGCFFGTLPGVGSAVATYCSYALERRVSRNRGDSAPASSRASLRRRLRTTPRCRPPSSRRCYSASGQRDNGRHAWRSDDPRHRAGPGADVSAAAALLGPDRKLLARQHHARAAQHPADRHLGQPAPNPLHDPLSGDRRPHLRRHL